VIDAAIAEHLEVLGGAGRGSVGDRLVKGISHAHAFDWLVGDAVDRLWCINARGFEDGRHDIDDVMELRAKAAAVLDVARAMI